VVLEFGVDPGLEFRKADNGKLTFAIPIINQDSRPTLYRYITLCMAATGGWPDNLHLISFDETAAMVYSTLLGTKVESWPVPRNGTPKKRERPITIGFIGHKRGETGFSLLPEIMEELLKACPDVTILYQNGCISTEMTNIGDRIKNLAKQHPQIKLCDGDMPADQKQWQDILDQCSMVVMPYMPAPFIARYSSVACECCANGIPIVCPDGTSMARFGKDFGSGMLFDCWDAPTIVEAIRLAVKKFDILSERAFERAQLWTNRHGAKNFVDRLLEKIEPVK
jgi:hypothetical protein